MLLRKEIKEVIESRENFRERNIMREIEQLEAFPAVTYVLECSGETAWRDGVD